MLVNLKEILDLFLIKTPENINVDDIKKDIMNLSHWMGNCSLF